MLHKIKTFPDLSINSAPHQQAKALGNEHYRMWGRNVADHLKDKTEDEIKSILKETAHPFAVLFENWISDFNMSSGIRNANGFNAKEVYYIGDRKYDKRGAVGTFNYTDVKFINSIDELKLLKNNYVFVGIDNVPNAVPINNYQWADNSLMIFGSEGTGLTTAMLEMCKDIVYIPMMGSVRSFNCAASSAIVMYDYINKFYMKDK